MKTPTSKSLLTDSEVRKIYESRLPEFRESQLTDFMLSVVMPDQVYFRNVIPRTIKQKRAIVYKMKAKYLNKKSV